MFSADKMVKYKAALESMYDGTLTISEYQKYKRANGSTGHRETVIQSDIPCRLSYSNITDTSMNSNGAASVRQVIKLFLAPDIMIKTGSKLTVTQHGRTVDYKRSGEVAVYDAHQEVILELFDGWS